MYKTKLLRVPSLLILFKTWQYSSYNEMTILFPALALRNTMFEVEKSKSLDRVLNRNGRNAF